MLYLESEGIARRPIILCSGLAYRIIIKASHDSNKEIAGGGSVPNRKMDSAYLRTRAYDG